jgi:beta-galactosidase
VGDFTWAMFDNNCGGEKKMQEWGIGDIFRIFKFTHFLFRSQLKPFQKVAGVDNANPVVFIANWWTDKQEGTKDKVIVYSNCDKIVLSINGKKVGEKLPDHGPDTPYGVFDKGGNHPFDGGNCTHLVHPPFTFNDIPFQKGELKAEGFIDDKKVSEQVVNTPGNPTGIRLEVELSGRPLRADRADAVFVYASLVDAKGSIACFDNSSEVEFTTKSGAQIVGPSKVKVRGGIATVLVQSSTLIPGDVSVTAKTNEFSKILKIKVE